MHYRLCDRFGLTIPIVQAPTASIAGPELAAAVSAAGGLGSLGSTWTSSDEIDAFVRGLRWLGSPFMVNYALSFVPASLDAALNAGAPVVGFSWGLPDRPVVDSVRAANALMMIQVGSVEGARMAEDAGADAVICQGQEAGGHVQSTTPLRVLLEHVRNELRAETIVIAAGGLTTGEDIAAAILAGADGVMLGTRFVATQESRAHLDYKAALCDVGEDETSLTVCFDGGWSHSPHRVLRNSSLKAWEAAGCPPPGARPGEGETVALSALGEPILRYDSAAPRQGMQGSVTEMALYAGTGVHNITSVPPAAEVLRSLWSDALAAMRGAGTIG